MEGTIVVTIDCGKCGRPIEVEHRAGSSGFGQMPFYEIPCPYSDCGALNHKAVPGDVVKIRRADRPR